MTESLTATELVAAYRARELSPVEVTAAVLDRAEKRQPELNCFYRLDRAGAVEAARSSERRWAAGEPAGPIDGVPVTVKENIAVAGVGRPSGTAAKADAPPEERDGPATARIRESGGVLFGITVMPDYGMLSSGVSSLHGITRSPWNPAWTVGGSSGGAAAAAAARIGPLHVGSDIGGSIRLPAGWLGLAGLKPSFGRVPVDPPYLGRVAGPIARTVADAALLLSVLARPDDRDFMSLPPTDTDWSFADGDVRGLRIGFHLDGGAGLPTDPEVAGLVAQAVEIFAAGGADVSPVDAPMTPELLDDLDRFLRMRSWVDVQALPAERRERVLPFILDWAGGAAGASGEEILRCYESVQELRRRTVALTGPFDVVLSPVAPVAAFPAEWPMPSNDSATALHHIAYTAPYNFSEQPSATVNCGFTADGRPVGLQVTGRRHDDAGVLRAAAWYERARPAAAAPAWPD